MDPLFAEGITHGLSRVFLFYAWLAFLDELQLLSLKCPTLKGSRVFENIVSGSVDRFAFLLLEKIELQNKYHPAWYKQYGT